MKKLMISLFALSIASLSVAQDRDIEEIDADNSWLKVGLNAGIPVGETNNISNFQASLDLSGQFMRTDHFGLGVTTGYTHYFGAEIGETNTSYADFGSIPLQLMVRYYPEQEGFFAGADAGYSFITNWNGMEGGVSIRPHVGYHNYDWNFFLYYGHTFSNEAFDVQKAGLGITYNVRFK
jgi:hypothetical protein